MGKDESPALTTGRHGAYNWLTSKHRLDVLLRLCPETVLGKYVAVTSIDSSPLLLTKEERAVGWQYSKEIAYSPSIQSTDQIPRDGYDEWYVFNARVQLGQAFHGNLFENLPVAGRVNVFVNYGGFALHDASTEDLVDLLWQQLEAINPESYVADGDYLNFATRNQDLFAPVHRALCESRP